jgi:asparagine synthase (glutamine-hydrolysing)
MCGIAGILKFDRHAEVQERRLRAMRDSLVHRGPDDAGLMVQGRIGLAHRRLSIIDLAGGHQPMSDPEGKLWISYNGELYNYRTLREDLRARGCEFTTQSDTEVVLRAFEVFGEACVEHLRGMFAFAIWDDRKQKLFLARDRLGIKPLYLAQRDDELLFASEIKGILAGLPGPARFNRDVLPEFLASRYVAGEETFFEGVRKLLPGHWLSWTPDEGIRIEHYWEPPFAQEDPDLSYDDYVQTVRAALEDAVESHLVSDVPLGLFLSGGIDSTVLASLMAPRMDGPVHTFSVAFQEREANELEFARIAARNVNAEHREVLLSPRQFFDELPRLIWHEDEPIAFSSSVPLNVISEAAREHVKVVLTGEGADELFLGYDYRYRVTDWNLRLGERYRKVTPDPLRSALARSIPHLPWRLRRYAERSFLSMGEGPRDAFFENFSVFRQAARDQLLRESEHTVDRDVHDYGLKYYEQDAGDILAAMSRADLQTYLVELLMKQDQMSMAASLESRVPFLDHPLVETVCRIPGKVRLHGNTTKALMRDVVRDLVPEPIMNRGKMGFPVPIGRWLAGPFEGLVDEFVLSARARDRGYFEGSELDRLSREHRGGRIDHADRLWLLINLEIWQRLFVDGEPMEGIQSAGGSSSSPAEPSVPEAQLVAVK